MKQAKNKRIPLVNGKYLCWTLLILAGELILLCGAYLFGVLDNVIGYIILPFFGFLTLYTAYEAFMLALEAISISSDGVVVAGKDTNGQTVHFELDTLMCVFPCDQKGNPLPENQDKYENIGLAFRFKNGKQKIRQTSRLTAKQLACLRQELGATYVPEE